MRRGGVSIFIIIDGSLLVTNWHHRCVDDACTARGQDSLCCFDWPEDERWAVSDCRGSAIRRQSPPALVDISQLLLMLRLVLKRILILSADT